MGAWIEIYPLEKAVVLKIVAPLMGAWIEIKFYKVRFSWSYGSRPSWARGLKSPPENVIAFALLSRPSWARGLKYFLLLSLAQLVLRRAPHGRVD